MGRNVYVDGQVYCDWRINVYDCVDSGFFYTVNLIVFCLVLPGFVLLIFDLFFRHFALKDSWASFKSGINLAAALLTIFAGTVVLDEILLLFVRNQFATGIVWTFTFPLGMLPLASYFYTVIATFEYTSSEKVSKRISEHTKVYQIILLTLWSCLIGFQAVLLIASEYYTHVDYQLEISNNLFRSALAISAINLFIFAAYEFYFAHLFLQMSNDRLKIISAGNIQSSDNEMEMVQVAIEKLRGNVRVMVVSTGLTGIVFLAMAIEPEFFANLVVSKIFCVLGCLVFTTPFLMSIFFIIMNSKKLKLRLEKKQRFSSYSSKGHETESRLSNIVREMDDLKVKDSMSED